MSSIFLRDANFSFELGKLNEPSSAGGGPEILAKPFLKNLRAQQSCYGSRSKPTGDSPMLLPVSVSGHRGLILPLLVLALAAQLPRCAGESATCLGVYQEGGAPAVFQSAHCPRWTLLPSGGEGDGGQSSPKECHLATDRGSRRSQEDRAVCALGIRIPFIGTAPQL